jgi:hypothetical protein
LVDVGLLAANCVAVREFEVDRRKLLAAGGGFGEGCSKVEELRPLSGVLGANYLFTGGVHQSVSTIPEQPALRNIWGVEFFPHHRLDGIAPQ